MPFTNFSNLAQASGTSSTSGTALAFGAFDMSEQFSDEFYNAYCYAAGRLVGNWAFVEHNMDMCIATIFQAAGGKHLQDQLPRATTRKITFLKLCFRKLGPLKPHAEEALPLWTAAKTLSHSRHAVAHGVLVAWNEKAESVTLSMLDAKGTVHQEVKKQTTFKKMAEAADACGNLTFQIMELHKRLLATVVLQNKR